MNLYKFFKYFFLFSYLSSFSLYADIKDDLVAHYKFDGTSRDVTGKNKSAKVERVNSTSDRFGNEAGAYQFKIESGMGGSRVDIPVNISPDIMTTVTVAGWYKATQTGKSRIWSTAGYEEGRGLSIVRDGDKYRWAATAGDEDPILGSIVLKDQWTFIAVMYDAKAYECILVVNDKAYKGKTKRIKKSEYIMIGGNTFNGAISDFRIYNRALSKSELEELSEQKILSNDSQLAFSTVKEKSKSTTQIIEEPYRIAIGKVYIMQDNEIPVLDTNRNTIGLLNEGDTINIAGYFKNKGLYLIKYQNNKQGYLSRSTIEDHALLKDAGGIGYWLYRHSFWGTVIILLIIPLLIYLIYTSIELGRIASRSVQTSVDTLTVDNINYYLDFHWGEIEDLAEYSESHVNSTQGSVNVTRNSVRVEMPQIYTTVKFKQRLWIRTDEGNRLFYDLTDVNMPLSIGHRVLVVTFSGDTTAIRLYNLSSGHSCVLFDTKSLAWGIYLNKKWMVRLVSALLSLFIPAGILLRAYLMNPDMFGEALSSTMVEFSEMGYFEGFILFAIFFGLVYIFHRIRRFMIISAYENYLEEQLNYSVNNCGQLSSSDMQEEQDEEDEEEEEEEQR